MSSGLCVVEGARATAMAFDSPCDVVALYVASGEASLSGSKGLRGGEGVDALLARASAANVPIKMLGPGVLEHVSATVTPQPVLATVRIPDAGIDTAAAGGVSVVLAGVSDPGNAGTIVRAAEASGVTAVVFCAGSTDPFSPKVIRASAGSVFQIPVVRGGGPPEVLEALGGRGIVRLGTRARGGTRYDVVDWSRDTALVLGNEAWGVTEEVQPHIDGWVTVPMAGRAESLNVAMAASVVLFEALRRRRPEAMPEDPG